MFRLNCLNVFFCTIFIANIITSSWCHAIEENRDLQNTYPWINGNLFKTALQQDFVDKKIVVKSFSLKLIPQPIVNYKLKLIQASVKFEIDSKDNEKKFVIKLADKNIEGDAGSVAVNTIKNEIEYNQHIIPGIRKMLATINEDDYTGLRVYESNVEKLYILLGDPKVDNFGMYDKLNGLTKEHLKAVFKKLARFHAASKFLKAPLSNEIKSNKCNGFDREETTSIIEAFVKLTKKMAGFENISKKLENSAEKFYQKASVVAYKQDDQTFFALCHHDVCHNRQCTNNIMFRNDANGQPKDAILTEYPSICWGPAVTDLASAFYTSSHPKLRGDDWDELVQYYHEQLIETLKKLNYPNHMPTLTELQVQLLERGISFVSVGLFEAAERHYNGKNAEGLLFIKDANESIRKRLQIIESAKDADELKYMLHYFDRKGYFDV